MKLLVVHWNRAELEPKLEALRTAGHEARGHWSTEEHADIGVLPDAFVLSLDRLPSHSRSIAEWVWEAKSRRHLPILFVGGKPDKVDATRDKFPAASFCAWEELPEVLSSITP